MDPQKFGDSYDFVKSVPRQLFLPRIASLRNVTENRSYKVSWRIQPRNARKRWPTPSGRSTETPWRT